MVHIFVLNPYAGLQNLAEELRKRLECIEGLKYYIFNTREAGKEKELIQKIQKIFENESIRLYSCGGSGTICNLMNGINDFSNIELAFYPCGLTNDFLKVFGKNEKRFHDITNLINGEVHLIDYIQTNHGVALNTLSVGLDSKVATNVANYRFLSVFGENVPYFLGYINAMFLSRPKEYEIYVDDEKYEGAMSQLCFGNGNYIGGMMNFSDDVRIGDGYASYVIGPPYGGIKLLPVIKHTIDHKIDKLNKSTIHGKCKKLSIKRIDGEPFQINFDGEMQPAQTEWTARIINKGLKFIVPKGVKVND